MMTRRTLVVALWTGPDRDDTDSGLYHYFLLTDSGTGMASADTRSWFFNEQPTIFSDGFLDVCVFRGPSGTDFSRSAEAHVTISGRLVAMPAR